MKIELRKYFDFTLLVVCTVDLLATAGDSTFTWSSPMYPKLYSNDSSINPLGRSITPQEDSLIGSLLSFGCVVGPFPFVYVAGKFGRKYGLLCIAIPHIISYLTMAFTRNIYLFYFARFIGGLSVGAGYSLIPMYIAEISRDANRGAMSLTLNVFWAIGNFLPYAIGPFLSSSSFNSILALIPITFFVVFWIVAPESPYYLIEVGQIDKAEESLMSLRSTERKDVQEEIHSIKTFLMLNEDRKIVDIIKDKALRKALIICLVLVGTQELSGFCAITFHLQLIFESAGTNISSDISALIVGFALLLSSFISPFLVDNAGRRPLTIYSCLGMFAAQVMLGIYFYIHDFMNVKSEYIQWMPITSLMSYIIFFNLGICTVPWTLTSELFPNNVKKTVASLASSFCYLISFFTTFTFNDMNDAMGKSGTFWFFGGLCLCCGIFTIIFVPETKGKSFSEIQMLLRKVEILNDSDDGSESAIENPIVKF